MIKPQRLKKGDKVAIVSLSAGTLGEKWAIHRYYFAKERLENDFGLKVVVMENTLKGIKYLDEHPEARAKDLMDAFKDDSIKAVFNAIGGDDTIRLLPYIDFEVIRNHPKVFTGYSDTTINHLMMYKAGLVSYYGLAVLTTLSEYVKMDDYSLEMMRKTLFEPVQQLEIYKAPYYYDDDDEMIRWDENNINVLRQYHKDENGYEVIQGNGVVEGELLGGCLDTFIEVLGTELWPDKEKWKGKIMFLETSEVDMSEYQLAWILRNFMAQGLFDVINGIVVGKPSRRKKYEIYKKVYQRVIGIEAHHPELPILYNANIGHALPIAVIPYGVRCRLDLDKKTFTLLEPACNL